MSCSGPVACRTLSRPWIATGLAAAAANALVVALALIAGGAPGQVLPWAFVPVAVAGYLLAPAGRRALRR